MSAGSRRRFIRGLLFALAAIGVDRRRGSKRRPLGDTINGRLSKHEAAHYTVLKRNRGKHQ